MSDGASSGGPPISAAPARRMCLDAERLDVYRLAVAFQRVVVAQVRIPRTLRDLRDQLDRASASIVLNIAEGAGRERAGEKSNFYSIARGSAMESAAVLDVLAARGAVSERLREEGRGHLIRIVQMLTALRKRPRRPPPSR